MNPQHEDLDKIADKLMKDKIEKVTPVPLTDYEKCVISTMHVLSLPTISEIYAEILIELIKYAFGIAVFLYFWELFSLIMDIIFA